jgi:hypothetical protein
MITIKRNSQYANRFRAYKVFIDDVEVGKIENGQEIKLKQPRGKHQLRLKVDWCSSNFVEINSRHKSNSFLCGSNAGGLLTLFYLFAKDRYLWLKAAK